MCTVSFINLPTGYCLTSNRDEHSSRKIAFPPDFYTHITGNIIYPKDTTANGTWFATKENGNCIVLLNGGFEKHIVQAPYRKSRGLILLDIFDTVNPVETFNKIDLHNIEPFTLVILFNNELWECRWTGTNKHTKQLNIQQNYIWSSATLYTKEIIEKREQWFNNANNNNALTTQEETINFHEFTGDDDIENNLLMQRNNTLFTVSITSVFIEKTLQHIIYKDIINNTIHKTKIVNNSYFRQTIH